MTRDEFPSVTTVLAPFGVYSEALPLNARASMILGADRGTRIHAFLAAYARKLWAPIDPDIESQCVQGAEWLDQHMRTPLLVEERLYDDVFQFSGQPDLVFVGNDDKIWLVDWKSSLGLSPLWKAQLRAYQHLAEKRLGLRINMVGTLRLGRRKALFAQSREGERDLEAFLCALRAYIFFKKGGNHGC